MERRDPRQYRERAERFRQKAAIAGDTQLQDSYLNSAREYELLAELLEQRSSAP